MPTESSTGTTQVRKAVVILEDEDRILAAWTKAIQDALPRPEHYVFGAHTKDEAIKAIADAEEDGYQLVLALADKVLDQGRDPDGGPRFLRWCKENRPDALRVMFSGYASTEEVQQFLDQGLIHHFQSKSAASMQVPEGFLDKVKEMVLGKSRGNVSDPDFPDLDREFLAQVENWIQGLSQGEDTDVKWLTGDTMKARDILKNERVLSVLRRGYMRGSLHLLFTQAGKK